MPPHIKWPSITSFHNVRKTLVKYPELTNGDSRVVYRGKVKLHGSNSSIQFYKGLPYAQSRTQVLGDLKDLSKGNDNAGFRRWAYQYKEVFTTEAKKYLDLGPDYQFCIWGEWVGRGIQKGCAIHQVNPVFAVFAIMETGVKNNEQLTKLITEPSLIKLALKNLLIQIPEIYVLPWEDGEITVDWTDSVEQLQSVVDLFNKEVERVESCDPWVKKTFGIEGTGEGLVYYPVSSRHNSRDDFSNLGFKAKGDKHKVVKTKKAVQVDPEVAASMLAFAEMVCTEARLEQGVTEACSGAYEQKCIGKFIGWVASDIHKECEAELQAAGLKWRSTAKVVVNYARSWYMKKIETI
jgi:hypothetical protein